MEIYSFTLEILNVTNWIKDIHFKILHRFLFTNRLLYELEKVASQAIYLCSLKERLFGKSLNAM